MGLIAKDIFVCLDCETTGLDVEHDSIIEIAAIQFTFDGILDSYESLIDPGRPISEESISIHNITDKMVAGQPKIENELPRLLKLIGRYPIVGHAVNFDIELVIRAAKRAEIPCMIGNNQVLDTLRMARLYGNSPTNSLEQLRKHFNIQDEGAHRAMSDVVVNIEVFRQLVREYKTTEKLLSRLERPIALKRWPLGKHKGRPFSEMPFEYLKWAVNKEFDRDLIYSIKQELKRRNKGNLFAQAANPFAGL